MPNRYAAGSRIGPYEVVKKLGSGGMGAVLLVKDAGGTEVALKYCTATDTESVRRFEREVRAMQRVNHPNVVPVLAHDLNHNPPYFVMPVAQGSLDQEIPSLAADHAAALEAFLQLCAGVSAVHDAIGPHRDLKPHNALRMRDGSVAVSDFGLAKIDPRDTTILTQTAQLLGTNLYMAPEQRLPGGAREADNLVDVYALGATLFHLVTGLFPAVLDTSGLPPTLARIIRRATEQLAANRYSGVPAFAKAVADYLKLLRSPLDPLGVFAERLSKVTKRLAEEGKYSPVEVAELLSAVRGLLVNPSTLLVEFDRIPDVILEKAAKRTPDELADALEAYLEALDQAVGARGFAYAESVAARMRRVFDHADLPKLKGYAVGATLAAAVVLNRFAAMDSLENMLLAVSSDEDAEAVASALRDQEERFRLQASRYRSANIHRFLRDVVREVLATASTDEANPWSMS